MVSAYISCPVVVPMVELKRVYDCLGQSTDHDINIKYWQRGGPYDSRLLFDSDIFILMTDDNSFKMDFMELPIGCRRELLSAIRLNKQIFLAYKPQMHSVGNYCFYDLVATLKSNTSTEQHGLLTGIPGTTGSITKVINKFFNLKVPPPSELRVQTRDSVYCANQYEVSLHKNLKLLI